MDLASDENGIWAIYRKTGKRYAFVSKLDPISLKIIATKRLKHLRPHSIGQAFIVCGVLYTVDSGTKADSRLGWAYDLYQRNRNPLKVDLKWINLRGQTVMVNYNPDDRKLYVYDKGYLINVDIDLYK